MQEKINENITAPEVRVILADGTSLGVLSRAAALEKAEELELDLVQIATEAKPPVCKLINYKKFLFAKKKHERKTKSGARKSDLKTFKFGPNIGEHDLKIRLDRAEEFLKKNNKVRFIVQFRGRQNVHPELGFTLSKRIIESLAEVSKVEAEPKKLGNFLTTVLMPK